jgi:hypothetical protein
MSEFVWVSISGRKPVPAELCTELGKRVVYTLQRPDQYFPDEDTSVKVIGPMKNRPKGLRPVRKEVLLGNHQYRKNKTVAAGKSKELRGGLECDNQPYFLR